MVGTPSQPDSEQPPPHALSSLAPNVAAAPFDRVTYDTLAICSSDKVLFHVRKGILAEASGVFEEMFGAPNPSAVPPDEIPVQLQERPCVFDRLFRICYPVPDPTISTIQDTLGILDAAEMYMMPYPAERMLRLLARLAQKEPLRLWAIFYSRGLPEEARRAALLLTAANKDDYVEELEIVDAGAYWALMRLFEGGRTGEPPAKEVYERRTAPPTGCHPASDSEAASRITRRIFHSFTKRAMGGTADAVIRTCDGESFYVETAILGRWSPVLRNRLAETRRPEGSARGEDDREYDEDGMRIVSVEEDSWVMARLLRFIYPGKDPRLDSLDLMERTLLAAVKYKMTDIVESMSKKLLDSLDSDPLGVYALATACKLRTVAKAAALTCLSIELTCTGPIPMSFGLITAGNFHRLRHYHQRCAEAALSVLTDLRWFPVTPDHRSKEEWVWFGCTLCRKRSEPAVLSDGVERRPSLWWYRRVLQPMAQRLRTRPRREYVNHGGKQEWPRASEDGMCRRCSGVTSAGGREVSMQLALFRELVILRVDRAVDAVALVYLQNPNAMGGWRGRR
ncbi:hypothetical protein C8Q80DRAFT_806075 [Daedaleopsis nitida]|nr:hypothetical protein C8Q80DRAFT_806075 [Daedaleopsis nitida]